MIELEKTYLASSLPDLSSAEKKEMIDIYIPKDNAHPTLRIRKNGDKYEMTKKEPIENDPSKQLETTIPLREDEFLELEKNLEGKRTVKTRFMTKINGFDAEIDVFRNDLKGLVVIDFEFSDEEEKNKFEKPDFCLADITPEDFIAGGMICGKKYSDIEGELSRFNYKKIDTKDL
jgi:adenylate cyclase